MLVLTRRKEETIIIGDKIEITVLGIRGEQVRLGISAPPEVPVHRKEVYESLPASARVFSPLKRILNQVSRLWGGGGDGRRSASFAARRSPRERNHRPRESVNKHNSTN